MSRKKHQKNKTKEEIKYLIPGQEFENPLANIYENPKDSMAVLINGMHTGFWMTIKSITQANIDWLSQEIKDLNKYSDQQRRDMIAWRNYQEELINLPQKIIESLKGGITDPINFDPYQKVYQKITSY